MTAFVIPEQPCQWCSRFVGHFEWCPHDWTLCRCNMAAPEHQFGMDSRCMYVNDSAADANRPWRGISISQAQLIGVADCHWPNPTTEAIIMRKSHCPHGTHPWEYAS